MLEYLAVGKIINTHGIKGEVKVLPLTDDPERFEDLDWVYLDPDSAKPGEKSNKNFKKLNIEHVKYFKNTVILKFKDISTMDAAEALKNMELKVDRANAVKLPEDSYFICDLIGCLVYEDDKKLGELKDIIITGSNDVYVVKPDNGKDILVPALKAVVKSVDIKEKRIMVKLPEGLLDDEV